MLSLPGFHFSSFVNGRLLHLLFTRGLLVSFLFVIAHCWAFQSVKLGASCVSWHRVIRAQRASGTWTVLPAGIVALCARDFRQRFADVVSYFFSIACKHANVSRKADRMGNGLGFYFAGLPTRLPHWFLSLMFIEHLTPIRPARFQNVNITSPGRIREALFLLFFALSGWTDHHHRDRRVLETKFGDGTRQQTLKSAQRASARTDNEASGRVDGDLRVERC